MIVWETAKIVLARYFCLSLSYRNITNPITGQDLLNYDLIPSITLQAEIEKYK